MNNICLSGGAVGSDSQWGMTAGLLGHSVIHWSFDGHNAQVPDNEIVVLSEEQLSHADIPLENARKYLGRTPHPDGYIKNLLRRNWYQVQYTERVYAVSSITDKATDGGTGYAVAMFLQRFNLQPCECYVYDQFLQEWLMWNKKWVPIDMPPEPYGVWAGIGTRKLNNSGKSAIRKLMKYVKPI